MARLKPGDTIGILGGGQLGRMLALAAARVGLKAHIFCPDKRSPAFQVADAATVAPYADEAALAAFARAVDVVTYEFENIPAETVAYLKARKPLRPGEEALRTSQDRLSEKTFLERIGVPTAPYRAFSSEAELAEAADAIGYPCIAKTRRFGYDGRGQTRLEDPRDVANAWQTLGTANSVLEGFVPFDREISVIVARALDGRTATFPLCENTHVDHILDETLAPARVSDAIARTACAHANRAVSALGHVGVLTVEMFVIDDGEQVIANEIAPRVHNSGHWTIEGATTSQFEQHVRAIAGWPLGDPSAVGTARMKNLIGHAADDWAGYLDDPAAHLHLYGKHDARPGRKMGHVTWVDA